MSEFRVGIVDGIPSVLKNEGYDVERFTTSEWGAGKAGLVMAKDQVGIDTDTNTVKIGDGTNVWASLTAIGGGVTGPVTSTDNAVARFNDAGGATLQDSGVIVDDSNNIKANNFIPSFATTATAAGTTTLTAASASVQEFTGATTQTITLPVVSTLATGWGFAIINKSSGALTINSSGGNLVKTAAADTTTIVTANAIVGTGSSVWDVTYITASSGITNGAANNIVPKSDGTNLVTSNITDSGTAVSAPVPTTLGSATATRQFVVRDLNGNNFAALYNGNEVVADANYALASSGADTRLNAASTGNVTLNVANAAKLKVDESATATHTALLLWDVDNATLERVTVGAADSGGVGFKLLRIPN